jgi:O-acetylhomoserine/O-acetylserine sulfhydrylase-like pyridoxal-dependent enzyme
MNVNAGHGQPKIVAAIQEQAAAIAYAYPGIATMLNFDVADCDKDRAFRFLDALRIILPATTLGDIYSLIVNPARTTHHWLDEEELARVGISPGTFRMSVGIENIEDLKEDLDQTLKACR